MNGYGDYYFILCDDCCVGVIMYFMSLFGVYGIGDVGLEVCVFVDWMVKGKMSIW